MFIVLSLQRPELKVCMHVTNFTICSYSLDLKILLLCTKGTVVFFCYNICGAPLQPLQINFLCPIHCPHLVTVSSNYSIILYSSIIFQLGPYSVIISFSSSLFFFFFIIIIIVTEQTAQLICSGKKSNHKMNLAT